MKAEKIKTLEILTGIKSSKKNYYVELQKQIEEVVLRNKQLEIFNQVAMSFNKGKTIEYTLRSIKQNLREVINFEEVELNIFIENACRSFNLDGKSEVKKCTPNVICLQIIKSKKSLILPDEFQKLNCHPAFQAPYLGSAVFVPLIVKNKTIGIITVKDKERGIYSRHDVEFLEQLAEHLAVGIANVKLFSEVLEVKREWEETFQAITDALLIINADFEIVRFNAAAKEVFNLASNEVPVNKKCYEIIKDCSKPCKKCVLNAKPEKQTYRFDQGEGGKVYDVFIFPVLDARGKLKGVVEYFKDVTQQIAMERQLVQAEKLAAIGKLAAGVAHELNSPLTAILGNAQLLLRELSFEEETEILMRDIKLCGQRCKKIVQNLLSFSFKQQLAEENFCVYQAVDSAIHLVAHQIRQNHIKLVYEQQNHETINITGSRQELEQVVINLLLNAQDALENRQEDKKIIVTSGKYDRQGENYFFITVEDNGCGIEERQVKEIFEPFYTTKKVGKGTGLGLAVSMGIVQKYGGTIECESRKNVGSKFSVVIPIK